MSCVVNPGNTPVEVARWVIAPSSSKATHSITGQEVDQLPDKVADSLIVRTLVGRRILVYQK